MLKHFDIGASISSVSKIPELSLSCWECLITKVIVKIFDKPQKVASKCSRRVGATFFINQYKKNVEIN